ncbi:hypothetical protein ACTWJ9_06820 [Streptomyces sp. GDS52]|uniref:hypothetical protein n=1 Tax=Streptomyces sp. GDS52 TaxID=3406419 RepID=UPI003FD68B74
MAVSLIFGVAGCGGDGETEGNSKTPKGYKVVSGVELCGGNAVSAEASKALKVITGMSRFEASGEEYTIAQATEDLIEAFPVTTVGREDICRVYTPMDASDFDLRITWRLVKGAPPDSPAAPKFTVLKMGEETLAAADMAYVQFACRSERLLNSSRVGHIRVGVEHWDVWREPEGDVEVLKDAYATVAHSVSLAMARELRCEKDGGLPARPVLDPA